MTPCACGRPGLYLVTTNGRRVAYCKAHRLQARAMQQVVIRQIEQGWAENEQNWDRVRARLARAVRDRSRRRR